MKLVYLVLFGLHQMHSLPDIGWIWHVTDFHYDFSYWSDQFSCNAQVTSPGIYGDYWCDSPWLLIKDSIEAMKVIRPDVDFLLWTGDNIAHIDDKDLTIERNLNSMQNITNALTVNFPNIPVYATLGNHDYLPNNQFPPNTNELYNKISVMWKDWIKDAEQVEKFKQGAYYSVKTSHGLRIVGLNTNLYYTSNKQTINVADPAGQFSWLDQQLISATKSNEKVLITAHIPPGIHTPSNVMWFYEKFNNRFLEIINKHVDNDVIVGMYYGHDHADGFKVFYKSDGTPAFPILSAPSVTPWRYKIPSATGPRHNPGIRLISYDRKTGQPINILMYYIHLPDSNSNNKTDWKLEYNFAHAYEVADVRATSLHGLTEKMTSNKQLMDKYVKFKDVLVENPPVCDDDCHNSIICGFNNYKMSTFLKCKDSFTSNANHLLSSCILMFLSWSVLLFLIY